MRPLVLALSGAALLAAAQAVAWFGLAPLRTLPVSHQEVGEALQPGEFAGTLLLGGMRGLACDLLWLRADAAKTKGRFYESVALAEAICRIQPRFEPVWEYLSWDMAYNLAHEVEDDAGKWSWYLAGIRANVRGCERNPHSERILRHLAWLFHHKGDLFHRRIEAVDWRPLLGPVFAAVSFDPGTALEPGSSNFAIAARLHQAAVALAERRAAVAGGPNRQASFVRRMVPLDLENAGNIKRNRAEHLPALRLYLDGLRAWQEVKTWADGVPADERDANNRRTTDESHARNEGRLRRKAVELARRIAPDEATAERMADAITQRRLADAEALLGQGGWKQAASSGGIRWLDER